MTFALEFELGRIFPPDTRTQVPDTEMPPFWWFGRLTRIWPTGQTTNDTATLIGDQHILTSAHSFYNLTHEMECEQAFFTPAANNVNDQVMAPYGMIPVTSWRVLDAYKAFGGDQHTNPDKFQYDFAVGHLETTVPTPPGGSLMNLGWTEEEPFTKRECVINGYPGDKKTASQWTRSGEAELDPQRNWVTYRMSTFGGDSGAAVYYRSGDEYRVVAVHAGYHGQVNLGPALNTTNVDIIRGMLS